MDTTTPTTTAAGRSADPAGRRFPADFVWGAATSSFQIEGGADAGGRGLSIWDVFCRLEGVILDGSDGRLACDHYTRYADDVELMRRLGLGAYRFSVAWPRVVPGGRGAVETRGLDFYDALVDALLDAGIVPLPTLYHWDLPQALEDDGGWTVRTTAEAFADYAEAVVGRLGDRVPTWMTLNEPMVSAHHGYVSGEHAPGRRSLRDGLAAAHHLNVAHGLALERIRTLAPHAEAGIVLNFTPAEPADDSPEAIARCETVDDFENRWYIEPIAGLGYPRRTVERFDWDRAEVLDGDLELIARPIDVLGVNFYTRQFVAADEEAVVEPPGPTTAMGWEIHPDSLRRLLIGLHERYAFPKLLITENGAAMPDVDRVGGRSDGQVDDQDRIEYLRGHLTAVHDAIEAGVPVRGYFVWSLMDNFEWGWGYSARFGIIEIDPDTKDRRPKRSADWYASVVRSGVVPT